MKLDAEKRESTGRHNRRLTRAGKLPAIVYGDHTTTTPLLLDGHEFQRVYARAGRTQLVDLVIDGGRPHKVLVKEVQTHPRRTGPIHVDFHQVSLMEKLHVEVPIVVIGESEAVKRGDGDVLQAMHSLRVECLPTDIPEMIEIDVSVLDEVDQGIRVSDLAVIEGVTYLADAEDLVVKIAPRRDMAAELEAEEAAEAVEAAAEGEAPVQAEEGAEGERAPAEKGETAE